MKTDFLRIGKIVYHVVFGFLLVFFLYTVGRSCINNMMPYEEHIVKKLKSPDCSRTALLVNTLGLDRNFIVRVEYDGKSEPLFRSRDYNPDQCINWHEDIIWSADSSFLVLALDDVSTKENTYKWGFDFKNNSTWSDQNQIISILERRNSTKAAMPD